MLAVGALVVLLVGLAGSAVVRSRVVPALSLLTLAGAIGTEIWRFQYHARRHRRRRAADGRSRPDHRPGVCGCGARPLCCSRSAPRRRASAGHGEFHGLLLFSVMGMAVLVSAQDLITLFLGLELLSIPLYILCAAEYRREGSLESGLKYLIIGSVGSATLVYGLAHDLRRHRPDGLW